MAIAELVHHLKHTRECVVYPPAGHPSVSTELPSDLDEFYRLAGGAVLFQDEDYSIEIVPPTKFVRANPIIAGEDCADDISFDWYIIGVAAEQYITIDLAPSRRGRCYDSFWDRHGVPGECQIVAMNFTSLLEQLINGQGRYWYWLDDSFTSLGDAYD